MKYPSHDEKAKYVHQLFESIADKYDRMNTLLSFSLHKLWRRRAMREMNVFPGDTALDVCCGTCDWTISLSKASEMGRIIGLDFSNQMLEIGHKKIKKLGIETIQLIEGDAMKLPFPENTFDHVTVGFALRNVKDFEVVLKEMKRVVKPGGQVATLELSKPTSRIFRKIYYFYFQRVLPFLGHLFAKSYEQYRWLPESLLHFPDYKELQKIIQDNIGLKEIKTLPLSCGIAALHIGKKSIEKDVCC